MEEEQIYGMPSSAEFSDRPLMTPEIAMFPSEYHSFLMFPGGRLPMFGSDELLSAAVTTTAPSVNFTIPEIQRYHDASSSLIKAKIASHPHYPRLLQAYIDCQKVGAPPEIASLLEETRRENDVCKRNTCFGSDPELDEFMETYYALLVKYKSELMRPFDEATSFLNKIETQLSDLCTGSSLPTLSDDGGVSSEDGLSTGDGDSQDGQLRVEEDRELKDKLLRKFGSHIGSLKLEFSKKKKRSKLPKDARQTLLQWWNLHYQWPYPTEDDKIALANSTGLDQKQINNWFINQRKRHWKPSENMQLSMMDHLNARFHNADE